MPESPPQRFGGNRRSRTDAGLGLAEGVEPASAATPRRDAAQITVLLHFKGLGDRLEATCRIMAIMDHRVLNYIKHLMPIIVIPKPRTRTISLVAHARHFGFSAP